LSYHHAVRGSGRLAQALGVISGGAMNIDQLLNVGSQVVNLLGDYTRKPHREMLIDPVLFAYLRGRFETVSRQHHVSVYGSTRPKRIDFRVGGTNPVVLELAVRPPTGGGHL
jgi:hypothetical protein